MAGIQLGGLASGLDTQALIQQLMAAEQGPRTQLVDKQNQIKARQQALGDVATRLQNLKDASAAMRSPGLFADTQTVDVSDPTKLAATRLSGTGAGAYEVSVTQLARAEQRTYAYTASASDTTLTVGGHSTTISANATLDETVSKINGDSLATVYAANVNGNLVLSSRTTGSAGFSVSGDAPLVEDTSKAKLGQDAKYSVDGGAEQTSQSNTVADAIPGLSLTFKSSTVVSGPTTIVVGAPAPDATAIQDKVKAFVDQYNSTVSFIKGKLEEQRVPNPTTDSDKLKGLLRGDPMLSGMLQQLRASITDTVPGNPSTLDQLTELGVSTGAASGDAHFSLDSVAGVLTFDTTAFTTAITSNPAGVKQLLGAVGGIDGFAQKFEGLIDPATRSGGSLDAMQSSASSDLTDVTHQIADMDTRLAAKQQSYQDMFTRLETALAQSQALQQSVMGQLQSLAGG